MYSSLLFAFSLVALFAAQADATRSPSFDEKNLKVFSSMGLQAEWTAFKDKYDKSYPTAEEEMRRKNIFAENLKEIEDHKLEGFTLGINSFSDMKNCGSCYAFSVTGTLEAQNFKKTKKLVSLSEQQIVDCADRNYGCGGGWRQYTYDYIAMNGGIDTEESYPYEAVKGPCRFNKSTVGATCTGYMVVYRSESALMKAVAEIGPIAVGINAGRLSFQHYKDGVYTDPDCIIGRSNHAVLVVGYGETPAGKKYWVVKNSWGSDWGNEGYIFMARNGKNQCGITDYALYPTG